MARGGARPGSGPAPSLDALKRVRDGKEWVKLPKAGLDAEHVPEWPAHMPDHKGMRHPGEFTGSTDLQREQHEAKVELAERTAVEAMARNESERDYWRRLWEVQPQAHVWRADGTEDQVALFVRVSIDAASPGGTTAARSLVKQMAGELLLNTAALHSARYIIDREMSGEPAMPDHGAVPVAVGQNGAQGGRSVRDGLHVVPPQDDDDDDDE